MTNPTVGRIANRAIHINRAKPAAGWIPHYPFPVNGPEPPAIWQSICTVGIDMTNDAVVA
jgi:hypothetical protein